MEAILEFTKNKLAQTADFFIKHLDNELEMVQELNTKKIENLEIELKEKKEDFTKERDEWK